MRGIGEEISGLSDPFHGLIDEVRISTVARSDALLEATWRNGELPLNGHRGDPRRRWSEAYAAPSE